MKEYGTNWPDQEGPKTEVEMVLKNGFVLVAAPWRPAFFDFDGTHLFRHVWQVV
jgi:hypothetical protein